MTQHNWLSVFPHQLSWFLDNPLRRVIVSPNTLADCLAFSNSSQVLELGPGPGYFSVALASRLGNGRLELFDLQPEMIAKAKRKLERHGFHNIGYTVGDANEELPFPDCDFDVALLCSVLGEVTDQAQCLKSLYRVLRPEGTLAFHESFPDPDFFRLKTLQRLVKAHGFRFHRRWGRPWNYIAVFKKANLPESESAA